MFLAKVAGNNHAQRITMPMWQRHAIHFVGKQRHRVHGFLERNRVGVIIDTMQTDARGIRKGTCLFEEIAQGKTFPDGIADQARIQTVADAH